MDSELDRTLGMWDEKSCREFEEFLDSIHDEEQELLRHEMEPPCTCYYTDVDVVENRYCEAHGPRF